MFNRTYADCEFVRRDMSPRGLISVGLTDQQGRNFYAVNAGMDYAAVQADPFLREHVLPQLPRTSTLALDRDHPDVKPAGQIRDEIAAFFAETEESRVYAYYGAGDVMRIHALWGHDWNAMPSSIPRRLSHDLADLIEEAGVRDQIPEQQTPAHHALNDAQYNRLIHEVVMRAVGHLPPPKPPTQTREQLLELLVNSLRRGPVPGRGRTPEELAAVLPQWVADDIAAYEPGLRELRGAAQATELRYREALARYFSALTSEPPA